MPEPRTEAEYETAVKWMLTEMERLHQQMECDRKDIERLQAETREILATWGSAV